MGYTHYFTQRRDIGRAAWSQITEDLGELLKHAEHVQGIAVRDGSGEGVTRPHLDGEYISFNGAGDNSHESFVVERIRTLEEWQTPDRKGWGFCKTARKPYDIAVTAALCYLASVAETHTASSDGRGTDWLAGLEMARQALPRYSNQLDIPREVLEADRWHGPRADLFCEGYEFGCMVDGRAYILGPRGKSYRFHSHHEAAQWAATWREKLVTVSDFRGQRRQEGLGPLFGPTGFFDETRRKALATQQRAALRQMLERAEGDRAAPPPAFVRPGEMPTMDESPQAYSFEGLLKLQAA